MDKKRILVVEDDDFFREAISDLLKKNYDVNVAPNGKAAIEQLSLQDFDLVLTDIQMPMLTGLELLEWSKKNKPLPRGAILADRVDTVSADDHEPRCPRLSQD